MAAHHASAYRALFRIPGVKMVTVSGYVARLPDGMLNLAILLSVSRSSSLRFGALTAGVYSVVNAVASPLRGRLVDRRGPRQVLEITALAQCLALSGLAVALAARSEPAELLCVAVAGLSPPPLVAVVRGLWSRVLDTADLRAAAFAAESALGELVYLLGTALAGTVAGLAPPYVVIIVAMGLRLGGSMTLARTPLLGRWTLPGEMAGSRPGALRSRGLRLLLVTVALSFVGLGAVDVAVTSFASHHHAKGFVGLALAMYGLGSAAGGLLQGARPWRTPLIRQQAMWLSAAAILLLPLLAAPDIALLIALLLIAGFPIAPASTVSFTLVARLAPVGTDAEAYTWLTSASFVGLGLGLTIGGRIGNSSGGFGLAIGCLLAAAACSLLLGRLTPAIASGGSELDGRGVDPEDE